MASPSGTIRTQLGRVRAKIQQLLGCPTPRHVDSTVSTQNSLAEMRENKRSLLEEREKLQRSLSSAERYVEQWQNLLATTAASEDEQQLYDDWMNGNSGNVGLLPLIEEAEDRAAVVSAWISYVEDEYKSLILQSAMEDRYIANGNGENQGDEQMQRAERPVHDVLPIPLPQLRIPQYDGDILKWAEFYDSFKSSIHDSRLAPVLKFTHLKSLLKGRALQAIEGISMTGQNYEEAIAILQSKFGNRQHVKNLLYSNLRLLPQVRVLKTVELRSFTDELEKILRQLHAAGEEIEHPSLVNIIRSKLSEFVRIKLEEQNTQCGEWTVNSLRNTLKRLVEIQEKASYEFEQPHESLTKSIDRLSINKPTNFNQRRNSFTPMIQSVQQMGNRAQPKCLLCEQSHFSDECSTYTTLATRKSRFMELKRCFICTKVNCTSRDCRSPKRECVHCKVWGKHARMLCPNLFPNRPHMAYSVSQANQIPCSNSVGVSVVHHADGMDSSLVNQLATGLQESSANETMSKMCDIDLKSAEDSPVKDMKTAGIIDSSLQQFTTESIIERRETAHTLDISENVTKTQLMTLKADAINCKSQSKCQVRVFFDTGSHLSFISAKMARMLNAEVIHTTKLSLNLFGDKSCEFDSELVKVKLLPLHQSGIPEIEVEAYTAPQLTKSLTQYPLTKEDKQFLRLHGREISYGGEIFNIDVIIGQDYFWEFIKPDNKIRLPSKLWLIDTYLGPVVTGLKNKKGQSVLRSGTFVVTTQMNEEGSVDYESSADLTFTNKFPQFNLSQAMRTYFSIEGLGVTDDPEKCDNDIAIEQFKSALRYENSRYLVSWIYKPNSPKLPNNYNLALGRLRHLFSKFLGNPSLFTRYKETFKEQLREGVIEAVNIEDADGLVHYIPHLPVLTPTKATTKLRIVFDASAKQNKDGISLNDCLLAGPCLLPDLCGLLMRFRLGPIAIISDIQRAFLQIGLNLEARDVTRFLWLRDMEKVQLEDNIQAYRFCRLPFGISCSPYILNGIIEFHLKKTETKIAQNILKNMYVDNLSLSVSTNEEAFQTYSQARKLFSEMSMNLREWATNCEELEDLIPCSLYCQGHEMKTLGIKWHIKTDTISLVLSGSNCEVSNPTKRIVLQTLASLFDPMGLFSPVTLQGKLLLKKLWEEKVNWDTPLSPKLKVVWQEVNSTLREIPNIKIPRYIGTDVRGKEFNNTLLVFTDASVHAFAAVIYLRSENIISSQCNINLIFSKTRIAKEKLTLPRLELMGVLIGTRAINFAKKQLQLSIIETFLFTDSQIVLSWLKTTKQLGVFVANRVTEINHQKGVQYFHVNSSSNPADCASRGLTTKQLVKHPLWWHGPQWAKEPITDWPSSVNTGPCIEKLNESDLQNFSEELKTKEHQIYTTMQTDQLIQINNFSNLQRLIGTVKYVLLFCHKMIWKKLSADSQNRNAKAGKLISSLEDVFLTKMARKVLIRIVQKTELKALYELLEQGDKDASHTKMLRQYKNIGPILCADGVIRLEGRFQHVQLLGTNQATNHSSWSPILLPSKSVLTKLLVQHVHSKNFHCGVQHTLALVRKTGFWILQGRVTIKRLLKNCMICRKVQGGPYKYPPMAPLPTERVNATAAFRNIGIDYFGPMTVKWPNKEKSKVWVCLFTCLVTRAIHLEAVSDMTAKAFLNAFKRFASRRGYATYIVSDNAPQFKLVNKIMKTVFAQCCENSHLKDYLVVSKIQWNFITQYSPWKGGIYERLVGITKQALKKSIGMKQLEWDQFITILAEAEAFVNTRPLTTVTEEFNEKCLTPIDLVQYNNTITRPFFDNAENPKDLDYTAHKNSNSEHLLKYWNSCQSILSQLWEDWQDHYILCLKEKERRDHRSPRVTSQNTPKLNEVVLVLQENMPRGMWKLATIIALHFGEDQLVRSATVRLANGTATKRSINHLIPLELSTTTPDSTEDNRTVLDKNLETEETEELSLLRKHKNTLNMKGKMNGQEVNIMFDSGCSSTVIHKEMILRTKLCVLWCPYSETARQSCIKLANNKHVDVLGSTVFDLQIGHVSFKNVQAIIADVPSYDVYLGLDFMSRISPYQVHIDQDLSGLIITKSNDVLRFGEQKRYISPVWLNETVNLETGIRVVSGEVSELKPQGKSPHEFKFTFYPNIAELNELGVICPIEQDHVYIYLKRNEKSYHHIQMSFSNSQNQTVVLPKGLVVGHLYQGQDSSEETESSQQDTDFIVVTLETESYEQSITAEGKRVSIHDLPPPPDLPLPSTSSFQSKISTPAHSKKKILPMKLGNCAACLPHRATPWAAGIDLYSSKLTTIKPKEWQVIDTAVHTKIPENYFGLITARSGLAANQGVTTMCGTIDNDYVGALKVVLINHSKNPVHIAEQQAIAQLIILPYSDMTPRRVNNLPSTERNESGLGSTDRPILPIKGNMEIITIKDKCVMVMKPLCYISAVSALLMFSGAIVWAVGKIFSLPKVMSAPLENPLGETALYLFKLRDLPRRTIGSTNLLRSTVKWYEKICKLINENTTSAHSDIANQCRKFKRIKEFGVNASRGDYPPEMFENPYGIKRYFNNWFKFDTIKEHITDIADMAKWLSIWVFGIIGIILLFMVLTTIVRLCKPMCTCCKCIGRTWWRYICNPLCKTLTDNNQENAECNATQNIELTNIPTSQSSSRVGPSQTE